MIFLAALVVVDFVLRRTTYGRKVFAVGGGIEAARRAGINVPLIRITVFAISVASRRSAVCSSPARPRARR